MKQRRRTMSARKCPALIPWIGKLFGWDVRLCPICSHYFVEDDNSGVWDIGNGLCMCVCSDCKPTAELRNEQFHLELRTYHLRNGRMLVMPKKIFEDPEARSKWIVENCTIGGKNDE